MRLQVRCTEHSASPWLQAMDISSIALPLHVLC